MRYYYEKSDTAMIPLLDDATHDSGTRAAALRVACLVLVATLLSSLCIVNDAHACRSGLSIADKVATVHTDGSDGTSVDLDGVQSQQDSPARRSQHSLLVPNDVNPFDAGSTRSDLSRSPPVVASSP